MEEELTFEAAKIYKRHIVDGDITFDFVDNGAVRYNLTREDTCAMIYAQFGWCPKRKKNINRMLDKLTHIIGRLLVEIIKEENDNTIEPQCAREV